MGARELQVRLITLDGTSDKPAPLTLFLIQN